jgi:enamine deaminase RidA (YjgF/YER057c/UK114 family)
MSIERKHTGPRMSQIVAHGDVVYLAGQVGDNTLGAPIEEQTRNTLANIDRLLGEAGTDKSKLLTATVWLTDMRHFDAFNAVWDAWVAPDCAPARACVEAKLAAPGFDVEIMVVAAR